MSFPRYAEYKESGVEWFGEVPAHWLIAPLKHVVSLRSGGTPSKSNLAFWDGDVPWASSKDLKTEVLADTADHITPQAVAEGAAELVPVGSVLIVVRGMILAHTFPVATVASPMAINQDLKALTPRKLLSSEFLAWLIRGAARESLGRIDEAGHGTKVLRIEAWTSMPLAIPPSEEQAAIAAFLDSETAKIDALVSEQRRLMELLKEKRQAVISHAVTKGLDPDAPVKGSGVEWLGDIPATWGTTRLKHSASLIIDCPHDTPVYSVDGEYKVIRTADLSDGGLDDRMMFRVSEAEYIHRVRRAPLLQGDIVYGREGERWGHAGLVPTANTYCLGQRMMQFRANEAFDPTYLMWSLNADSTYVQGEIDTVGATSPHVNVSTIRNYVLVQPPIEDQRVVAAHLAKMTLEFDDLIEAAVRATELLHERRYALISAAVTGQIDVRKLAPTEAA